MYYFGSLIANCNKFSTKLMMIYDETISIKHTANHRQLVIPEPYLNYLQKYYKYSLPSHKPEC